MQKIELNSTLIYDGDCPVCNNYVVYSNARKNIPHLKLISARDHHFMVKAAWNEGFDLNNEMVLYHLGKWYGGADVVNKLVQLGNPSWRDRLISFLVGSSSSQKWRYQVLVRLRKILLRMLGRSEIKPPEK